MPFRAGCHLRVGGRAGRGVAEPAQRQVTADAGNDRGGLGGGRRPWGGLYVDNGQILTSAGAAAGLDLCLHMIRKDYGSAVPGTSTRTLIRRFREQTGTTPLQWLHRARIRQAQHLLESTHHTVERIGAQVGFGSPTAFRDRFKKTTGVSPHSYRRAFS